MKEGLSLYRSDMHQMEIGPESSGAQRQILDSRLSHRRIVLYKKRIADKVPKRSEDLLGPRSAETIGRNHSLRRSC